MQCLVIDGSALLLRSNRLYRLFSVILPNYGDSPDQKKLIFNFHIQYTLLMFKLKNLEE